MNVFPILRKRRRRLIVFTRYPRPGDVKTRLIPALGAEGAAELQRVMTQHTMNWARELAARMAVSVEVHYDGGTHADMRNWLGRDLIHRPQTAGNLGRRMADAFRQAFDEGAGRVVIVGTDCPGITARLAGDAFVALDGADLALGPARDGGYYLIGLRKPALELFAGIRWGTGEVLERTLSAARELGLSHELLESLADVDRPEDLFLWKARPSNAARPVKSSASQSSPGDLRRISVIIPTLNEAAHIRGAVTSAASPVATSDDTAPGHEVEIIVVDGGSSDRTPEVAAAAEVRSVNVKVISGPRGRARQMNAGAEVASGDVLLFLHADTRLPHGFHEHVAGALADPGVAAGAFGLRFDSRTLGIRFIERTANWRARRRRMPYGDQAIFLRADTFRKAGGFPDIPIMEDLELVRRLQRLGRVVILPVDVVTSARRWLKLGVARVTLLNQAAILARGLGVSPQKIARWYRRALR